eukprot:jgi/Undpi1/6868/HiC_scaffold_21.g09344.m1
MTMFNCNDGDFQVNWFGEVNVPGTICIGAGATVRITGDGLSTPGNSSLNGGEALEHLTSRVTLPSGLKSAAVGVGEPNNAEGIDKIDSFGPIFYVNNGNLIVKDLIVRGGFASDIETSRSGGGIYSVNSNVTIAGCDFSDNFAENMGGGIFAVDSTLHVSDTMFRYCRAGQVSTFENETEEGAGGGIYAESSQVRVDGCLFEGGYATNEGAGISLKKGHMSVLDSVFYNNHAGGGNEKDEDPTGQGADLALSGCDRSFDGLPACDVNDTIFVNSSVANKGGSVVISKESESSNVVKFHGCTVDNSSSGLLLDDDGQGDGGAFSVGSGVTLLLSNCTLKNNFSGDKGGVFHTSSGGHWTHDPGATIIVQESYFHSNTAGVDSGGVGYLGEFGTLTVEGDGNMFERNTCSGHGGVFASTSYTSITVEGGTFQGNGDGQSGGVIWSKGNVVIEGGAFFDNATPGQDAGVLCVSNEGNFIVKGGIFENNTSEEGGVAVVNEDGSLHILGGLFSGNRADAQGGAFSINDGGDIQIKGGTFTNHIADFGGFLFAESGSHASCTGVSILNNHAVEGGAIYATNGVTLDWACHIEQSFALAGPAIYARDQTTVELKGVSLFNNTVVRGSVVFVVSSVLMTDQVDILDNSGLQDLSAVYVDKASSYMAVDTSFTGFNGEACFNVVFSEGELYLDDCDFSGSTSPVLVYTGPNSTAVIRNTALGNNNYVEFSKAGSDAGNLPNASSLTNANYKCGSGIFEGNGSSTTFQDYPCSKESACFDGDLGVYCLCYTPQLPKSTERCMSGDASTLNLEQGVYPERTYFPDLLEGDLFLSYEPTASSSLSSGSGGGSDVSQNKQAVGGGGVLWSVEATGYDKNMMTWTIFPSTGLIFPGGSITLKVVTLPGTQFEGHANVTFTAIDVVANSSTTSTIELLSGRHGIDDDDSNPGSSVSHQEVAGGPLSSTHGGIVPVLQETSSDGASNKASFHVEFYHCRAGSFWKPTVSSVVSSDEDPGACYACSENTLNGETEGVDCSQDGETLQALTVKEGYWRAKLNLSTVRECFNEGACKGGSSVTDAQGYCSDGYEGVVCSVCAAGYGRGAANQCHECTEDFKGGMFFVLSLAVLLAIGVVALLSAYLVGGRHAVTSTMAITKNQVLTLQRRSVHLLSRADQRGVADFTGQHDPRIYRPGFSSSVKVHPWRREAKDASFRGSSSGSNSTSGTGTNNNGRIITGLRDVRDGDVLPAKYFVPQGRALARIGLNSRGGLPRALTRQNHANVNEDVTGVAPPAGTVTRADSPGPTITPAFGGPVETSGIIGAAKIGKKKPVGNLHDNEKDQEEHSAAAKIGALLSGLPLSKLKLAVVVWQISSAFADVTNVGFPPVYEKFLSIIGMFSLDLGWLLSATCVASGVGFYEKLLTVTIGPFLLLGLLGVTFHVGSRPAKPRVETLNHLSARTNFRGSLSSTGNHITSIATEDMSAVPALASAPGQDTEKDGDTSGDYDTHSTNDPRVAMSAQQSWIIHFHGNGMAKIGEASSAPPVRRERLSIAPVRSLRSIWKAGPGNNTDPEQTRLWQLFARHTTMTLIILYLVYSQVSTVVFQAFACDYYEEMEKSFLRVDGRIVCYTATHTAYRVYAGIMICLYPFGIPAVFCYLLVRQRSAINPPSDKTLKNSRGKRHVVGCLVIFFTNFLALIIQAELADKDSSGSAVYSALLILVHVFFLLSICWNSWTTVRSTVETTFGRRHLQGLVLGVDLASGDSTKHFVNLDTANGDNASRATDEDYKDDEGEDLPSWQTQPAIPELLPLR